MNRTNFIIAQFKKGYTQESIGYSLGISRQRVNEILKSEGITGSQGGREVSFKIKWAKLSAVIAHMNKKALEQRIWKHYRCSVSEYQRIMGDTPAAFNSKAGRYRSQKHNAKIRGIPFVLSFPEWNRIWESSGKYKLRGTRKNRFVMARKGDMGPYALGNVKIILASENIKESIELRRPIFMTPEHARAKRISAQAAYNKKYLQRPGIREQRKLNRQIREHRI